MAKPWEKFDKKKDPETSVPDDEELDFTSGDDGSNDLDESEVDGVLSFDMGATASEDEVEDSDELDFNIDTSESAPDEIIDEQDAEIGFSLDEIEQDNGDEGEETSATVIFNKGTTSLDDLNNTSSEEELDKTINKIIGIESDDEIHMTMPKADPTRVENKLPAKPAFDSLPIDSTDEDDSFSLGDDLDDEDEDAATRILNLKTEGLGSLSDKKTDIDEDVMFGDGDDDEDAATRILQVNKSSLLESSEDTSGDLGFSLNDEVLDEDSVAIEQSPTEPRMSTLSSDELVRLQATIRQLRTERGELLAEISKYKEECHNLETDSLGLRAENDELKIELTILKKRKSNEYEDIMYQNEMANEKKEILTVKNKHLQKEFDRLNQKVRIDFNQVKQREKELESQLELVSMDSESQVRSRDVKILELKRHIDQLEFNMENASIKEQKSREDKVKLEDKLSAVIKSLRSSMTMIEDDLDIDEKLVQKIKKL